MNLQSYPTTDMTHLARIVVCSLALGVTVLTAFEMLRYSLSTPP